MAPFVHHLQEIEGQRIGLNLPSLDKANVLPRVHSFSTVAPASQPGSDVLSFAESPAMLATNTSIDEVFLSNSMWMLPPQAAALNDDDDKKPMDDPVSRVSSPPYKVPRLRSHGQASGQNSMMQAAMAAEACARAEAPQTPPRTPRLAKAAAPESPRTPRTTTAPQFDSPPNFVQKARHYRGSNRPALLKALQNNSATEVRVVLEQDPEAATEVIFESNFEPPLCCAARLKCGAEIIKLLLEAKANPVAEDMDDRTPWKLACRPATWEKGPSPVDIAKSAFPVASYFAPLNLPKFDTPYIEAHGKWQEEVQSLLAQAECFAA
jgi:hypothetical protein